MADSLGLEPRLANPEFAVLPLDDKSMAPSRGFEPQLTAPKTAVLPLDDKGLVRGLFQITPPRKTGRLPESNTAFPSLSLANRQNGVF